MTNILPSAERWAYEVALLRQVHLDVVASHIPPGPDRAAAVSILGTGFDFATRRSYQLGLMATRGPSWIEAIAFALGTLAIGLAGGWCVAVQVCR